MTKFYRDLFRKKAADEVHPEDIGDGVTHSASGLKRTLSVVDLTAFGIAAVIGAGIFSTIGTAAYNGGPGIVWLFILTSLVCGLSTACYAEFASKVPAAGSAYTYAFVSLGEMIAWIIGWDLIMEYAIGNIAVAISWSGYFVSLLSGYGINVPPYLAQDFFSASRSFDQVTALVQGGLPLAEALTKVSSVVADGYKAWSTAPHIGSFTLVCNLPAFGITALISSIAFIGIKESKWASNAMVALKILIILLVITVGAFYVQPTHWIPFIPNGMSGVMKGVSAVFFAYIGFDAISTMAEECKNPQRDLPRGMFMALGICTILYSAIALVVTGIVSYKTLNVADPLAFVFGPHGANVAWISAIVSLSAVVAMASVLLVFQVGQPRIWMAMSRDGLLPKIFSAIHPRFHTPWFSTILTGLMVGIPALFMNLVEVTDLTSIGTLFAFVLVCSGVVRLHERRKAGLEKPNPRGFSLPIISSRYWVPLICLTIVGLRIGFGDGHFMDFFGFENPAHPGVFDWETTKEKVPLMGYLIGTVYLNYLCIKDELSLIPTLGVASCGYLMTELGWLNWARFVLWLAIGLAIYFSYGRHHSYLHKREVNAQ